MRSENRSPALQGFSKNTQSTYDLSTAPSLPAYNLESIKDGGNSMVCNIISPSPTGGSNHFIANRIKFESLKDVAIIILSRMDWQLSMAFRLWLTMAGVCDEVEGERRYIEVFE